MSNASVNINNSMMALVILIIFCLGDPDIIDMCIKLLGALANHFDRIVP